MRIASSILSGCYSKRVGQRSLIYVHRREVKAQPFQAATNSLPRLQYTQESSCHAPSQ